MTFYRVQRRCEPWVTGAGKESGLAFHPATLSLWTQDKAKAERMKAELPDRTVVTIYRDEEVPSEVRANAERSAAAAERPDTD